MHEPVRGFRKEAIVLEERGLKKMVVGLGTDLVEIARIEQSIARFGERFLERIFTPAEISYCRAKKNAAESFAARFAAKEAAAKALGTGIQHGVGWQEIEVVRNPGQPPQIVFHAAAAERARALGVRNSAVSLSHSREVAMAVVILES